MTIEEKLKELIDALKILRKISAEMLAKGPPYPNMFFKHNQTPEQDIQTIDRLIKQYGHKH